MPPIINIAHAGARSLAPENTIAAARKAQLVGADMWELDVAVTSDGELILFHDDSLARTTNAVEAFPNRAPWTFTTFSLDEIRTLDAGSWFAKTDPFGEIAAGKVSKAELESYHGERVPTLREALLFTKEHHYRVNVELKPLPAPMESFAVVPPVLALIDQLDMARDVVISSFNHDWLRQVEREWPELEVQSLIGWPRTKPLEWDDFHFRTYNASATRLELAQIRMLREKGLSINVYTVNGEQEMRRFIAAGVTGLFTDFPQRLAAVLREEEKRS
ncbi:glycerophosphodiester phosphodiesterase [Candidatus Bipolaricaulota bacterium]|nr:glycerophosphodiester phosphodiesterase [Candidatus Bipolaricaulota bacterium]